MKANDDNPIIQKSMAFAIRCVKLARQLRESFHEYDLASQVIRSGTSIGANAREAIRGQSRADFHAKMNISLREAEETDYRLDLLYQTGYLPLNEYNSLKADCVEICKILMSIVKSTSNR